MSYPVDLLDLRDVNPLRRKLRQSKLILRLSVACIQGLVTFIPASVFLEAVFVGLDHPIQILNASCYSGLNR